MLATQEQLAASSWSYNCGLSATVPQRLLVPWLHAPQRGTHRTMLHIITPHPEPYHFTVTWWCITFAHKSASITVLTTHSAQQFPTRQMLLSPANPCDRHHMKICGSYCKTIALSQPHLPYTNWNCSCKEKDSYSPSIGPEIKKMHNFKRQPQKPLETTITLPEKYWPLTVPKITAWSEINYSTNNNDNILTITIGFDNR